MKPNKKMRAAIKAGKKSQKHDCVACNGTGVYDNKGSPNCVACNGTGRIKWLV